MDLVAALKKQHLLGLEMLRQCVELCPDDLWVSGAHPRSYWRVAYHAAYYTDLYIHKDEKSFVPWSEHEKSAANLWGNPSKKRVYMKAEVLDYIDQVSAKLDQMIDHLDLEAPKSGFSWYKMPKIELLMLNLRHLQGHVGQLSELLMAREIYIDWLGMN
jgi:hypothetical protein